jgi:hypothetical protein
MEKDKTINSFLERHKQEFNLLNIKIVDYWDGDLCAIGLENKEKLIYISTFNYTNFDSIKYEYDLEIDHSNDNHNVIKSKRNVTEKELMNEINNFFSHP